MWYKLAQNNILGRINKLKPEICKVAQEEYDKWDEEDIDTYAGGGICNYIAPRIADVVREEFPEYVTITATVQDPEHEFVQLILVTDDQFEDPDYNDYVTFYNIDIPYYIYETCKGPFCWKKSFEEDGSPIVFIPDYVTVNELKESLDNLRIEW